MGDCWCLARRMLNIGRERPVLGVPTIIGRLRAINPVNKPEALAEVSPVGLLATLSPC